MRIPRYTDYAASPELVSTRRIPDMSQEGAAAVGASIGNLGEAVFGAGRAVGAFGARIEAERERAQGKADAQASMFQQYQNDLFVTQYQGNVANVVQDADLSAGPRGADLTAKAHETLTKYNADAEARIKELRGMGMEEEALSLAKNILRINSTVLGKADEAQRTREFDFDKDYLIEQGDEAANATSTDRDSNDDLLAEFDRRVDNVPSFNEDQKAKIKEDVREMLLQKEAALTAGSDIVAGKELLGEALTETELVSNMLRGFEAFEAEAYDDSGQYSIGYGSGTVTRADGTVLRARPGMIITKQDAERDLQRRITTEFMPKAMNQIGSDGWARLSPEARAVATSLAYNYGEVPDSVVAAFQSGDKDTMADAVRALGPASPPKYRKGLTNRRNMEADIILGGQAAATKREVPVTEPVDLSEFLVAGKDPKHLKFSADTSARLGALLRDAQAAGHDVKIFSGYRSPEEQKRLWGQALLRYGSVAAARKHVAPPGNSQHNHGNAADLSYAGSAIDGKKNLDPAQQAAQEWVHANAAKYGLHFRMGHEPWHVEPVKGAKPMTQTQGVISAPDPRYASLSPKGRAAVFSQIEANNRSFASAMSDGAKTEYANRLGDYEARIGSMAMDFDLEAMRNDPWLKPDDLVKLESAYARANEAALAVEAQRGLLQSGQALDLSEKKGRDAAETLFAQDMGEDWTATEKKAASWMREAQFVPQSALGSVQGALQFGDLNVLSTSLPIMADLAKNNPDLMPSSGKTKDVAAAALRYDELMSLGIPAQKAAETVAAEFNPENKLARDELIKVKADVIKQAVTVEGFSDMTDIPVEEMGDDMQSGALLRDWEKVFTEALVDARGNEDVAQQRAKTMFKSIYGRSEAVGAPRYMRRPPEEVGLPTFFEKFDYPGMLSTSKQPVYSYKWYEEQAVDAIKRVYAEEGYVEGSLVMVPDVMTEAVASKNAKAKAEGRREDIDPRVPYTLMWRQIDPVSGFEEYRVSSTPFIPDLALAKTAAEAKQLAEANREAAKAKVRQNVKDGVMWRGNAPEYTPPAAPEAAAPVNDDAARAAAGTAFNTEDAEVRAAPDAPRPVERRPPSTGRDAARAASDRAARAAAGTAMNTQDAEVRAAPDAPRPVERRPPSTGRDAARAASDRAARAAAGNAFNTQDAEVRAAPDAPRPVQPAPAERRTFNPKYNKMVDEARKQFGLEGKTANEVYEFLKSRGAIK